MYTIKYTLYYTCTSTLYHISLARCVLIFGSPQNFSLSMYDDSLLAAMYVCVLVHIFPNQPTYIRLQYTLHV